MTKQIIPEKIKALLRNFTDKLNSIRLLKLQIIKKQQEEKDAEKLQSVQKKLKNF